MFAPPSELTAEVFARLPDSFRVRGRSSRWADEQRGGAATHSFLEGPSFDTAGRLFVVDIPWGRIFTISPQGEFELFTEYDGEPNGLKIHRDGRIFVADYRRGLMVVDPNSRRVEPFLDAAIQSTFRGLNDLHFALNGDLYFTDQGLTGLHDPTGRLFRLRSNGSLDLILDNVPSPNGLALNADQNTVYLNVTRGNCVWRVPMDREGRPFKVGVFVQLSGGFGGPDGMALDEQGNLAVAHFGLGTVWLFSPIGEPVYRIRSPLGLATTNVAYQGHFLYITESDSGTVLRVELPTKGAVLHSHC